MVAIGKVGAPPTEPASNLFAALPSPLTDQVLDAGTKQWSTLQAAGDVPCGREDTAWVFDASSTSLVLYGGWSSRWLGDTWRLDVSSTVGPGYACLGASASIGPVAGGTEVTITGLRFRWGWHWVERERCYKLPAC